MKQKLPIGIQDFAKIREDGFLYVDKTARIHELATGSGGVFFLSRPRRFGKSLLCSTLGALFEGRRELFGPLKGQPSLAIDTLDWEWKRYPVIRIDLNAGDYARGMDELVVTIKRMLELCAGKHDVPFAGETPSDFLARLIFNLHEKYKEKVIVIVDEYDKPLLATIDKLDIHKEIRSALKSFYGVLKSADEHLQMAFLTGVTKFAHVSVFSDLNNVTDISMNPRFYDLCGITQEELERDFSDAIARVCEGKGTDRQSYLGEVKRFYNGYRFSREPETVYNPFGLLNHFNEEGEFNAYWFATGTPTFLITLIEQQKTDILNLEKERVSGFDFQRFDVENMDAVPVLYQSGYLTIVGYDEEWKEYALDYPNEEVRGSFAEALLAYYVKKHETGIKPSATAVPKALLHGDVDGAMQALTPFFAAIPYGIQIRNEKYYQTVIYLVFRMLGLFCRSEVQTADGRIDCVVETKQYVYCFEFKLEGTAEEALAQIDRKEYLLPWSGSGKELIKVGVSFDHGKRNIGDWKAVRAADIPFTVK
jgi:hypothetical protein